MTTLVRYAASTEIFDITREALLGTDVHAGMGHLRESLRGLRAHLLPEEWKAVCEQARQHPVHGLLLESPFTRRAYTKPRGYAGDAVLMDLIYGAPPASDSLSPLGGMLYGYEFDSPCFQSVRSRRAVLAREIDHIAARRPRARVLSVACGHLREIEWSRAARQGDVSVTAIDQDRDSLDVVGRQYSRYDVSARPATIGDLLRRSLRFSDLDLAYAAGLYDYLDDDVATALTATLFRMLRPDGALLLANFTPATRDAAFMEAIMDWHLVYRTPDALQALTSSIPPREIAAFEQFSDDNGHIAYLRVVKR
jgi:extracellular factor (EF) 3-hydroxypalmitic acid methyl ester biosynthesis protein